MKTGIKLRSNRWILGDRPSFQKSRTHCRQGYMLYELIPTMPTKRLRPLIERFSESLDEQPELKQVLGTI